MKTANDPGIEVGLQLYQFHNTLTVTYVRHS